MHLDTKTIELIFMQCRADADGQENNTYLHLKMHWGEINCQFLLSDGSIGPTYVLQLLFSEKSQTW